MVWPFKQKERKYAGEEKFPELPELPELPPLPERITAEKPELHPLPSFPYSPAGEKITREAVKQAVQAPEIKPIEALPKLPPIPAKPMPEKPRTLEIRERMIERPMAREERPSIKTEPIFVRIDKYKQSTAELQEVKKKLIEIENVLRNIRDIRDREDAELSRWEEEIRDAKENLNNIDKTIFTKLEK